ncbi:uncharacterized protein LOC122255638 isoform X2 [Penaeus japonicus]|uniref:uncharacterized protein LOC122255638 isoform X2 n=1 Tax=Penaeus japonicus TaxID=27405 RepID=UPI001C711825|nr:uncharacterized protein LOC122255638 isoform X2 [Penaeus japonicus]
MDPIIDFHLSLTTTGEHDVKDSTQVPPPLSPKSTLQGDAQRFKDENPYDYPPMPRPIANALATSEKDVSQTVHETDSASFTDPAESASDTQVILDDPEGSSATETSPGPVEDSRLTQAETEAEDRPSDCRNIMGKKFFPSPVFAKAITEMKTLKLFKQRNQWSPLTEPRDAKGTAEKEEDKVSLN